MGTLHDTVHCFEKMHSFICFDRTWDGVHSACCCGSKTERLEPSSVLTLALEKLVQDPQLSGVNQEHLKGHASHIRS